jgi:thiol-disulfide isomerase/thioredoxin
MNKVKFTFIFIAVLLIQILTLAQNQSQHILRLTGTIKDMDSGYVYLNYIPNSEMGIMDSSKLTAGHFVLNGTVTEPTKAWFSTFGFSGITDEKNLTQFYIEPGDLKLFATKNHLKTLKLIGSASDSDRVRLEKFEEPINNEISSADDSYQHYDDEYRIEKNNKSTIDRLSFLKQMKDSIRVLLDKLYKNKAHIDSVFIIENPNSYVAADMLAHSGISWIAFPSLDSLYSKFPDYIKQSFPGKSIKLDIDREKAISVGSDAKLFIAIDNKGDTIKLSNYRTRKYVLLDFGASWCRPCRSIIPLLKKYYATYSSKFEIVSIANQDEENDWRKAIVEDNPAWPQIIENKILKPIEPANSSISDMYYISTIPSLILIDKQLKIIGKYGGFYYSNIAYMHDLELKLAEIFR